MEYEIELKLRVEPDAADRVLRTPALRGLREGRARAERLISVYFDTENCALAARGLALRIRHSGRSRVQTVKGPLANGHGGSLQRHGEWTTEIEGDRPDLDRIAEPDLRKFLTRRKLKNGLEEVFRTEIHRRTVPLVFGETRAELAFDHGVIRSGEREEPVCEIELELLEGDPSHLYDIALMLVGELPLCVEHRTKSARGYRLFRGTQPVAIRAGGLDLAPAMTVRDAFFAIANGCLAQLRANEMLALEGKDPEGLHQVRVSVRRLRAALSVFRRAMPEREWDLFRGELRWLQRSLGPARDWDVLVGESLEPLAVEIGRDGSLDALIARARAERDEAYRAACAALRSARHTAFQLRFDRWLEGGAAGLEDGPVLPFAVAVLDRCDRKLREAGRNLDGLSETELHDLRIKAKKTRYAAEFFRALFAKRTAGRYIGALKSMQDGLGALNDIAAARALMAEVGLVDLPGAALLDGWLAHARVAGKSRLAPLWQGYYASRGFWCR